MTRAPTVKEGREEFLGLVGWDAIAQYLREVQEIGVATWGARFGVASD